MHARDEENSPSGSSSQFSRFYSISGENGALFVASSLSFSLSLSGRPPDLTSISASFVLFVPTGNCLDGKERKKRQKGRYPRGEDIYEKERLSQELQKMTLDH
jgi:hypothetical protein